MYYHVWFVTKYRKTTLADKVDEFLKDILLECIQRHGYKSLELETNKDHVHILLEAKDKKELATIVRTIKTVSAGEILATQHFRVGNSEHFWARRYGFVEVGEKNIGKVREYIRNQKKIPHAEACGQWS